MTRAVTHRYVDPLSQVWIGAARRIGLRVVRTPDAYASTDGSGTLAIGDDAALDADDSLAQMIFHELCHSLVEGEDSFRRADWGMDNTGPDHDWREHACLRTQWVLAGRHGLRAVFAPTTDFRAFWNTLNGDVLADRTDPGVQAAIAAIRRAAQPPWAPALDDALAASARIAIEAAKFATPPTARAGGRAVERGVGERGAGERGAGERGADEHEAAGDRHELPVLWREAGRPPDRHPTGLFAGAADATCGSCAWRFEQRGAVRCRQAEAKIDDTWRACERYEAALDCQTCGACCRAAYHSVEVTPRDPVVKAQPSFIVDRGTYLEIRRSGDRCAALAGGTVEHGTTSRYHCVIYDDRPKTCRDFTLGSAHCLTARRRVGLSL